MATTKTATKRPAKKATKKVAKRVEIESSSTEPTRHTCIVTPLYNYDSRITDNDPNMPVSEAPVAGRSLAEILATKAPTGAPRRMLAEGALPLATPYGAYMRTNNTTLIKASRGSMNNTDATWASSICADRLAGGVRSVYDAPESAWLRKKDGTSKAFLQILSNSLLTAGVGKAMMSVLHSYQQGLVGYVDTIAATGADVPDLSIFTDSIRMGIPVNTRHRLSSADTPSVVHLFPFISYDSQCSSKGNITRLIEGNFVFSALMAVRSRSSELTEDEVALCEEYVNMFRVRGVRAYVSGSTDTCGVSSLVKGSTPPDSAITALPTRNYPISLPAWDGESPDLLWETAHATVRELISPVNKGKDVPYVALPASVNVFAGNFDMAKLYLLGGLREEIVTKYLSSHSPRENTPGVIVRAITGAANQKQFYI